MYVVNPKSEYQLLMSNLHLLSPSMRQGTVDLSATRRLLGFGFLSMRRLGGRLAFHSIIFSFDVVEGLFNLGGIVCCAELGVDLWRLLEVGRHIDAEEVSGLFVCFLLRR